MPFASTSTPGVFIEEKSTLPPSVAQVGTAIPAFIGYTERGRANEPVRIESLLEFRERFGEAPASICVEVTEEGDKESISMLTIDGTPCEEEEFVRPTRRLPYAIELYFQNGGGRCYVVRVTENPGAPALPGFQNALRALRTVDEPTLVVIPDAVGSSIHKEVCEAALKHCADLQDRFAILDVDGGAEAVTEFRAIATTEEMSRYGAAYYPSLKTSLPLWYKEEAVRVTSTPATDVGGLLPELASTKTALANAIKRQLNSLRVILPPSAAVAGIYARVDRERGVWKAPANEPLLGVNGPMVAITDEIQAGLNVDPTSGKSINAIRAFTGRGTRIWGARTLAGNDNQWRFVNVRRLFITVEESARKATSFAVFEPNDATTWLKVKGMLESYLYGLWERGALQGSKPEAAYFVNVGLGRTMTQQDVLEGRMVVEIGVAAVRPAEFITLRFSHMLASA